MKIRRVTIERFRGLERLEFAPGSRTVIIGPNNAGKSTALEALDLLLHPGLGRPRPAPTEIDYYRRDPKGGFRIEAVIGDLPGSFRAEVKDCLEGWQADQEQLVPELDDADVEAVIRVQVRGTDDFDVVHEFAKPEVEGKRLGPKLRSQVNWVFDGRRRDPARQLAFYQGGILDRLFGESDLGPAVASLQDALTSGAVSVNTDEAVCGVLTELAEDLCGLGVLKKDELPKFEAGSVSKRELLQVLRLGVPAGDVTIPIACQGRGAQRLILVAALLRLAKRATSAGVIGAFEEPEEALEPLRQLQIARMLRELSDKDGQIFLVTHSPEIVRSFAWDDILLMDEQSGGSGTRALRKTHSTKARQSYERWLDGPVVRGLFARVPVLVEGPSDRAVFKVFWKALSETGQVQPAEQLGVDPINCEGAPHQPSFASLLGQAGKPVAVWVERDRTDILDHLEEGKQWSALLLHDARVGWQNLEQALARSASITALVAAMTALAADAGIAWQDQQTDLVSRCDQAGVGREEREAMKATQDLSELLTGLPEEQARALIAGALASKSDHAPFAMKGGLQARIVAQKIVAAEGVPQSFNVGFLGLAKWIQEGCLKERRIQMGNE